MVNVTPERVRNRLNIGSEEVEDEKLNEFIKDATAEIELQTGREIDYENCSQIEAAAITDLAAIYCICYLTGGKAVGLNFNVGNIQVSSLSNSPSISILESRLKELIEKLREKSLLRD
ncbi:phage gp6-like head-tail connector protein [Candidatus Bathyarchaeota archaeon]|nr:phage gp6-like head-tail connector protein [Candidatus Bathyarchaeota archaeon]